MTREEIIKGLNSVNEECGKHLGEGFAWMAEIFQEAIGELEQESCKDAVSRKEIQQKINRLWNSNGDKDYCMETLRDFVTELSPVTPTRKKGKWIKERDSYGIITGWHCSNCYDKTGFVITCKWDYCPSCGAEMESEE